LRASERQTIDIDLVPLKHVTYEDQLKAIAVAVKFNLPPETINFSAEYFVKKQPGWQKQLVLMKTTKTMRLFRPNKKLFRKLKMARGSESDLQDIKVFESFVNE
jgi:hypothetical protein